MGVENLAPPRFDPRTVQPIAKSLHQLCYKQILKRDNYSTANLAVFNFDAYHTIFNMYDIKLYFKKLIYFNKAIIDVTGYEFTTGHSYNL